MLNIFISIILLCSIVYSQNGSEFTSYIISIPHDENLFLVDSHSDNYGPNIYYVPIMTVY